MTLNMAHDPEDSAGAQLALIAAVKLLLSAYRGNDQALQALTAELESMRANLLATSCTERKLHAFDEAAQGLLQALQQPGG